MTIIIKATNMVKIRTIKTIMVEITGTLTTANLIERMMVQGAIISNIMVIGNQDHPAMEAITKIEGLQTLIGLSMSVRNIWIMERTIELQNVQLDVDTTPQNFAMAMRNLERGLGRTIANLFVKNFMTKKTCKHG